MNVIVAFKPGMAEIELGDIRKCSTAWKLNS